jgi:hypothetical protein
MGDAMKSIRTRTGVEIGGAHISPPPPMSADAEAVQAALLAFRNGSDNDSIFGGHMAQRAVPGARRVRVGKRSLLWRLRLVVRDTLRYIAGPSAAMHAPRRRGRGRR